MTAQDISMILGKLTELRSLFVLGQRALPFLEEIFAFLSEIAPLLDEINASVHESTSKMPRATSQLQSVSQATELATNEILDLIDAVLLKSGQEKEHLHQVVARIDALADVDARLYGLLRQGSLGEDLQAQVDALHAEKHEALKRVADDLRSEVVLIDEVRDKINRIMMSLQVQDITTQQIAAVNHLIESIRSRMSNLLARLGATNYDHVLEALPISNPGTFDPNARYDLSGQRQADADGVVNGFASAAFAAAGPATLDDINALFGGGTPAAAPAAANEPATLDDIDALFGGGTPAPPSAPSEAATPDDIDALFGSGDGQPAGPSSQNEIDALFGAQATPPAAPPEAPSEAATPDDIDALFGSAESASPASQDDIDALFGG